MTSNQTFVIVGASLAGAKAAETLRSEGFDGRLLLVGAERERPDLILMDIQLPVTDGYEATRRIKSRADLSAIPVIAVTSYALSGDEAKAKAAGCDAYVTKPFSPRELLAKVRQYLPGKR